MSNCGVYVIHHGGENYPEFENNCVFSILSGPEGRYGFRFNLRDDTKDNIIEKHDLYSEFTGVYWIWKNRSHDIYGLMHYRSFLDLNDGKNHPQNAFLDHLGYNQKRIEEEMSDADVITSTPMTLQELGTNCLYDQFCACHPLGEKLFDTCASIIYNSKYDQYMDLGRNFNLHFYGRDQKGYYKCLTMANKKFFDAYCEFIFFMLDNVYARLKKDIDALPMYRPPFKPGQSKKTRFRLLAFLAERLTSLFLYSAITSGKFRVKTKDRAHYETLNDLLQAHYYPKGFSIKIPFFRFYCRENHDHLYTTDLKEIQTLGNLGYFCEGCMGYALVDRSQRGGVTDYTAVDVPIFRGWASNIHDHFYSTDTGEFLAAERRNYKRETPPGWGIEKPVEDTIPVYRFLAHYKNTPDLYHMDHIYTTDQQEPNVIKNAVVDHEGLLCYLLKNGKTDLIFHGKY